MNDENLNSPTQELVRCAICGIRHPISESYLVDGKYYCLEHRSGSKQNVSKKWWQKWWVLLLGFLFLMYLIGKSGSDKQVPAAPAATQLSAAPAPIPATVELPNIESQFINIVATAQQDVRGADNNMKKGGIKSVRDKNICHLLTNLHIKDWIATVDAIDSNSDGKGVLSVSLAKDITVKTWNNSFSDIGSGTLLDPSSAIFKSASNLKAGQLVKFSGAFLSDTEGCISEGSMSLDGKLQSPEYIFKFSSISAVN